MPFIIDGTTGFNLPSGADLTVNGNFTVSGTTTTISTETLTVDDNIIVLNNNEAGTPSENAGIEVERGTSTNVSIRWNETTDKWQFTNDGTTYTDLGGGDLSGDKLTITAATAPADPSSGEAFIYATKSSGATGIRLHASGFTSEVLEVRMGSSSTNLMYLNNQGNVSFAGEVKASYFVDSSNSSYYLDPSSTGTASLVVAGKIGVGGQTTPLAKLDIKGDTSTFDGMSKIYLTDNNSNAASRNWSLGNGGSGYGNLTFAVSAAKDGNAGDATATNAMVITSDGIIQGASNAEIKTSPIRIHSNTISTNTTIASTENAVSGGPVTIASSVTVTVDGDWTVV